MLSKRKTVGLAVLIAGIIGALSIFLSISVSRYYQTRPIYLTGAVIQQDDDPMKESPITGVEVSAADNLAAKATESDFSGFFSIRLLRGVGRNRTVTLRFRHPEYQPLDLTEQVGDRLSVVHLVPIHKDVVANSNRPSTPIANVLIRYSTVGNLQENIGTEAKTFEIPNIGNIPCVKKTPCSPDGKWKAAVATESMEAGGGNGFRNARVSCIAGPCPFTKIDSDGFSRGGQNVTVTVRNWSDTTVFLFQAEIFHSQIENNVRMTYPVILGRSLNFTLPPTAEGPSIEAEVGGENIIFPLGPDPKLSWASCSISVDKNKSIFYRCDLKSDYQFQQSK